MNPLIFRYAIGFLALWAFWFFFALLVDYAAHL